MSKFIPVETTSGNYVINTAHIIAVTTAEEKSNTTVFLTPFKVNSATSALWGKIEVKIPLEQFLESINS